MSKKESSFINMVVTLLVVTFVSSAAVGSVYEMTKAPIAGADLEKKIAAIQEVVPSFNNDPVKEKFTVKADIGDLIFYPAKKDGKLVATAIETFTDIGYGGRVKLMVGLLVDGTIYDIAVIEHKETPGLGDKMEKSKSDFSKQFMGKNPANFKLSIKKDGGNVDAITAATFSSRAFCDAVKRAHETYTKEKNK